MDLIDKGLDKEEAKKKRELVGKNEILKKAGVTWWQVMFNQIKSPLIYVLLMAAGVTFFMGEYLDFGVIAVTVVLSTVLGFIQEFKAERSLESLSKLLSSKALVRRSGKWVKINASLLVPGDVVRLEIGRTVPADGVLIKEDGVFLNEAMLTGESVPVEKKTFGLDDKYDNRDFGWYGKVKNVYKGFMGTVVEKGIGKLLVVRTGDKTKMGKIAKNVVRKKIQETPLQGRLKVLSRQLAIFVGVASVVVFVVGMYSGRGVLEVFEMAVALAVAAIPEGLAISLTVILTIGMGRILKRKALVRKLLAAETLGGVDIFCLDKTGTITVGEMEAVGGVIDPSAEVLERLECGKSIACDWLVKGAVLCNDLRDPLETAMERWAEEGLRKNFNEKHPRIDGLPFDHKYKYIITLHDFLEEKGQVEFISGAPEVVISKCKVDRKDVGKWESAFKKLGSKGYRLVGFGYKEIKGSKGKKKLDREQVKGYTWAGVVVYEDPVRKGVKESLERAKGAGIDVKVITGDYKETAWAVLNQAGLVEEKLDEKKVMVGNDFVGLGDSKMLKDLEKRVSKTVLFARIAPEQKLLVVKILQDMGHTVAMTGDGVNDAPALRQADIGIVVDGASDVARETSDMILLDNNFDTILAAVEEGRGILDNLKKVLLYLLADAFAGILLIVASLFLGWPLPLLAVQILWVNLISDGFPYLALTVEPKEKGLLFRKPIRKDTKILDKEIVWLVVIISVVAGSMTLGVFGWYYFILERSLELSRTLAFTMLGINSLFYVFSSRSLNKPIWKVNFFQNPWLIAGVGMGVVMQFAVVYVPVLQKVFRTSALGFYELSVVFCGSLLLMVIIEVIKSVFLQKEVVKN
jgi:P-type Ca2+ transporter type 2C